MRYTTSELAITSERNRSSLSRSATSPPTTARTTTPLVTSASTTPPMSSSSVTASVFWMVAWAVARPAS